jgi:hypothetical protein
MILRGATSLLNFFGPKWYSLRSPFQGPKKSRFSGPTPSYAPRNDVAPLKIITYCAIKTTGTLIVILSFVSPLLSFRHFSSTHFLASFILLISFITLYNCYPFPHPSFFPYLLSSLLTPSSTHFHISSFPHFSHSLFISISYFFSSPPLITYIKSTTVFVPSSEFGVSQHLSRQRVCPSPQNRGGGTLACG